MLKPNLADHKISKKEKPKSSKIKQSTSKTKKNGEEEELVKGNSSMVKKSEKNLINKVDTPLKKNISRPKIISSSSNNINANPNKLNHSSQETNFVKNRRPISAMTNFSSESIPNLPLSSRQSHKSVTQNIKPFVVGRPSSISTASSRVSRNQALQKLKQTNNVKDNKPRQSLKHSAKPSSFDSRSNHINLLHTGKSSSRLSTSKKSIDISSPSQLSLQSSDRNRNRKSTKGLPPTAVVAPIQDKSKAISKNKQIDFEGDISLQKDFNKFSSQALIADLSRKLDKENVDMLQNSNSCNNDLDTVSSINEDESEEVDPKMFEIGHYFQPVELKQWLNWCDACGGVIVTLFGASLTCRKCNMLCHIKCASAVSLTCSADENRDILETPDNAPDASKPVVEETKDEETLKEYNTVKRFIPPDEVHEKINNFNSTVKGIHQMTLQEDGETFRGFIRVAMNLVRPVSVSEQLYKITQKGSGKHNKASFYVDKGAVKALHITSETTAEVVVRALLRKYNITDNPMKFALFEKQFKEEGHVILRKMLPRERPLLLRLLWGNSNLKKEFILQENETRDIEWEAFSIAELQMFIKILDKEENDYITDIKRKYKNKAEDIQKAIEYQNNKT